MAKTPQTNIIRSSILKLPDIEHKKTENQQILENFGIKRKSVSKAAIFEENKRKLNSPVKLRYSF